MRERSSVFVFVDESAVLQLKLENFEMRHLVVSLRKFSRFGMRLVVKMRSSEKRHLVAKM